MCKKKLQPYAVFFFNIHVFQQMIKKKEAKSGKKKWEKNERKKLIITDGSIALAFKQILSVRDLNN